MKSLHIPVFIPGKQRAEPQDSLDLDRAVLPDGDGHAGLHTVEERLAEPVDDGHRRIGPHLAGERLFKGFRSPRFFHRFSVFGAGAVRVASSMKRHSGMSFSQSSAICAGKAGEYSSASWSRRVP